MTATASSFWGLYGKTALLGGILLLAVNTALTAQETSLEQLPGFRERAVVIRVVSRIIEQNQKVIWDSENTSITMPGRPVGLQLVSSDLVVVVQFTPFLRPNGQHTLVAQGQIWISTPGEGISFQTTMQTIPLELGEVVYFFPLGSMKSQEDAHIEIQLVVEPLSESAEVRPRHPRPEGQPQDNTGRSGTRAAPR